MGCFATGITVLTTRTRGSDPIGITVNSLTSVSLEPPLILFCLERAAHVYPIFKKSPAFAINILAEEQENISRHFADFRHHPEPKNIWERTQESAPILKHTLGWMICRKTAVYAGGDHDIFLAKVVKLHKRAGSRDPLLYFRGRYRGIGE
jgi:flavin reductase (DIM6/NTAB) family NADH-FMN oxidoreductase RutF